MPTELLGLTAGMAAILTAALLYLRHLRWKAIERAYEVARAPGGNALIWPRR